MSDVPTTAMCWTIPTPPSIDPMAFRTRAIDLLAVGPGGAGA